MNREFEYVHCMLLAFPASAEPNGEGTVTNFLRRRDGPVASTSDTHIALRGIVPDPVLLDSESTIGHILLDVPGVASRWVAMSLESDRTVSCDLETCLLEGSTLGFGKGTKVDSRDIVGESSPVGSGTRT